MTVWTDDNVKLSQVTYFLSLPPLRRIHKGFCTNDMEVYDALTAHFPLHLQPKSQDIVTLVQTSITTHLLSNGILIYFLLCFFQEREKKMDFANCKRFHYLTCHLPS